MTASSCGPCCSVCNCVALDRVAGDIPHIGGHLTDLGPILLECGDIQPAQSAFSEALLIHQEVGLSRRTLSNTGYLERSPNS